MIAKSIMKENKIHRGIVYLKISGLNVRAEDVDVNVDEEIIKNNQSLFTDTMNKDEWTSSTSYYYCSNTKEEVVKKNGENKRTGKAGKSDVERQGSSEQDIG